MGVGYGDSSEKSAAGGVSVPVIGLVTPAVADYDKLSANGGRVGGAGFGNGGLENEGAGREEFADGSCDGLAFAFGLSRVLEAKVVHAGGCKEVGDVCDAVT